MIKTTAMPIYGKTFKIFFFETNRPMAFGLDTVYIALGTQALQILIKWWPRIDHDLLYGKVKFTP